MVRARPADDDPADTDLEIDRQADRLQQLASSPLVEEATPTLREKVRALAEARLDKDRSKPRTARQRKMQAEGRAFEA